MNNNKPIDYYDRIADALEVLSGDDSHIDDEYKNMDYYDRIANALEALSNNPPSSGSGGGETPIIEFNDSTHTSSHTYTEIVNMIQNGKQPILKNTGSSGILFQALQCYMPSTNTIIFSSFWGDNNNSVIGITCSIDNTNRWYVNYSSGKLSQQ